MDYLTIPEASSYSHKPEITIRRMIKRTLTEGSPEEQNMIMKEKRGKRFVYKVSKHLLQREFGIAEIAEQEDEIEENDAINTPPRPAPNSAYQPTQQMVHPSSDQSLRADPFDSPFMRGLEQTVGTLRSQLASKDRQIEQMHELLRNAQLLGLKVAQHEEQDQRRKRKGWLGGWGQ